jgi:hypothetical protein
MYSFYDNPSWYDKDLKDMRDRRRKRSTTKNIFSAVKLVKTAVDFCGLSKGNILLMGGALSLPEISGFRSVRERSSDLDFIVNSDGLSKIEPVCKLRRYDEASKSGAYMGNHDGVDLAFFLNDVKGYDVSGVFGRAVHKKTELGEVFTVPYELNAALKVRRGSFSLKKRMYGKDGLDFAVAVHSKKLSFVDFSAQVFASYLKSVCESCELGYRFACLSEFEKQAQNGIRLEERRLVFDKVSECRNSLDRQCRYKSA